MRKNEFTSGLRRFFHHYLVTQRGVRPNTVKAYRDSIRLFLLFLQDNEGCSLEKVSMDNFTAKAVTAFLSHLLHKRRCSDRTCNQRLSAIHSLARSLLQDTPEYAEQLQQIIAIPSRKYRSPPMPYLTQSQVSSLIAEPGSQTAQARRDTAILALLYDTGARVQEIVDLNVLDVRIVSPAQVRLTGKGEKTRIVPLMPTVVSIIKDYLSDKPPKEPRGDSPLFYNKHGNRLTRFGISYILGKYAKRSLLSTSNIGLTEISPHVLRHSKAMHLLEADCSVVTIQAILGHADIKSTFIYIEANLAMKKDALEKAGSAFESQHKTKWQCDEDLLRWLESL